VAILRTHFVFCAVISLGVGLGAMVVMVATAKEEPVRPTQGLLYAQLGIESGLKQMNFRLSQKFTFGQNTSMKLFGSFMDGSTPHCRVQVRGHSISPPRPRSAEYAGMGAS
jgi:hypothetical protein